jgi:Ni/Co efflux regulator RcnB
MKKTIWVLAAALAMPAVAALGQQNGMSNGDRSSQAKPADHDGNHAMQTGSPNDNGAGLTGDYGKTHPGKKVDKKHHHYRRSKKYTHETEPNQSGTRARDESHPQ